MENVLIIEDGVKDMTPVIIDELVINEDAQIVIEETPVAVVQEPVVVKGFVANRNIKIDGVTTMAGQMIPSDIKKESLQVLLDCGYVLSVE